MQTFLPTRAAALLFPRWLAACICIISAVLLASCKHGPDASTPKKAAIVFTNATAAGDTAAARQVATGSDAEFELAKNLGQWMASVKRFKAASIEKFGDEGKSFTGMPADLSAELESANEDINGENATIVLTAIGKYPMKLVRDGSDWKVDLKFIDVDPQAVKSMKDLGVAAQALDTVSKDLEERSVKTVGELKIELGARVYGGIGRHGAEDAQDNIEAAQKQIAELENAIELYHANTSAYPKSLLDLVKQPAGIADWKGPYTMPENLNDPWNHPYVYQVPGSHNADRFDLASAGPDGKSGNGDDVTNWTPAASK